MNTIFYNKKQIDINNYKVIERINFAQGSRFFIIVMNKDEEIINNAIRILN